MNQSQPEKVGTRNFEFNSQSLIHDEIRLTEIYADLNTYKDMTQLELSKKIPKWKLVLEKGFPACYSDAERNRQRLAHVKKFCEFADTNITIIKEKWDFKDNWGHSMTRKKINMEFWREYRDYFHSIIANAEDWYNTEKEKHDREHKENMAVHQKTDVKCECGGHYSLRNKVKHCSTKKHLAFLGEPEK